MDPFSITAGVAGLLSLSIQAHHIVTKHVETFKNAPNEAKELQAKLNSLVEVLGHLEHFITRQGTTTHFSESSVFYGTIKRCDESLNDLDVTLNSFLAATNRDSKRLRRLLKWPLKGERHRHTITVLQEYIIIFQFAGQIDAWALLSETYEHVTNLHTSQAEQLHRILDATQEAATRFQQCQKQLDVMQGILSSSKRSEILNWIGNGIDTSTKRNNALQVRHPGSGQWLLDSKVFERWFHYPGLLWLYGIPGSGKTVLYATIVEQIEILCAADPEVKLAYYDFDFQDPMRQTVVSFVRCLLRQLSVDDPDTLSSIKTMHEKYRDRGQSPSLEELSSALIVALERSAKETYIIVDAVDECPENTKPAQRKAVFAILRSLLSSISSVHILVTSRDLRNLRDEYNRISESTTGAFEQNRDNTYQSIDLEAADSREDIESYVQYRLDDDTDTFSRLSLRLVDKIKDRILDKAEGMFLWVTCQLDSLANCTTIQEIENTLDDLPDDLDLQYERILEQIESKHVSMVLSIFHWLLGGRRELYLDEVAEAVALSRAQFNEKVRLIDPFSILHICRGLLVCTERWRSRSGILGGHCRDKVVGFAHSTVQEYLLSGRSRRFNLTLNGARNHVVGCCVRYLLHLRTIPDPTPRYWPLLEYAATYWYSMLKKFDSLDSEIELMIQYIFLGDFNAHSFKWLRVWNPLGYQNVQPTRFPGPLYYAVELGRTNIVGALVRAGYSMNERHRAEKEFSIDHMDPRAVDPHQKSDINHYKAVRNAPYREEAGSSPGFVRCIFEDQSALHLAVENRNIELVRLLLSARPGTIPTNPETPLLTSSYMTVGERSKAAIVKESSPGLGVAVANSDFAIAELLLKRGVSANTVSQGITALSHAVRRGRADIVTLLLENKADVNQQYILPSRFFNWSMQEQHHPRRTTALIEACRRSNHEIAQLCINHGALINPYNMMTTPLEAAVENKNVELVELLIKANVDVNHTATPDHVWSPLALAVSLAHKQMVEILLRSGAHVDQIGSRAAPLTVAAAGGHLEILDMLLDAGATIDDASCDQTALTMAACRGKSRIVGRLLERGANVNGTASNKFTPLVMAIYSRHMRLVNKLLKAGAAVNLPPGSKATVSPLTMAVRCNNLQLIKVLHRKGARVTDDGTDGRRITPLAEATKRYLIAKAQSRKTFEIVNKNVPFQLLQYGADPRAGSPSALHLAAWADDLQMFCFLAGPKGTASWMDELSRESSSECMDVNWFLEQVFGPSRRVWELKSQNVSRGVIEDGGSAEAIADGEKQKEPFKKFPKYYRKVL